jgi:superfamily II DNA or RNA helicase
MATGLGKTVIIGHVARRWPRGRILAIAHRDELIHQMAATLSAITGEQCDSCERAKPDQQEARPISNGEVQSA